MDASPESRLSLALVSSLVQCEGLNDCLHRLVRDIASALGSARAALYDYDERSDTFDVLHFQGYAENARSELRRRIGGDALRHALTTRDPYPFDAEGGANELAIPLYFQDILEAVLVVETADGRAAALAAGEAAALCRVASRFLGLFMSSSRLPVNARRELAAADDLAKAREVQLSYLPAPHLETTDYEIFGHNRSSSLVGGDYFDYFRHRPGAVQGIVADACGHGMSAALIMSTFRGLLNLEIPHGAEIPEVFGRMNRRLYREGDRLQYLTCVFFEFDQGEGELRFLNAGHFDPLLVRAGGEVARLEGGGPPLGMFRDTAYPLGRARPERDDLLVLFTDGLVELANPEGEFFEEDRIVETVLAHRTRPLAAISAEVMDAAMRFGEREELADDVTLFMMRFR